MRSRPFFCVLCAFIDTPEHAEYRPRGMKRPPHRIRRLAATFHQAGHELFIVGGAVRDAVLGRPVADYDFATSATPEEVQTLFPRTIPTGIQHGTVTVRFEGALFEITTYRIDGTYSDRRRPDSVTFTRSLEEDLSRRDLTINAMAMDPETGTIHDPFGGAHDLRARLIRTVGDPATRFREDALRILRAARFAAQLEFLVAPDTEGAMASEGPAITHVAPERHLQEFEKLLGAPRPSVGLNLLERTGVLSLLIPELAEQEQFGVSILPHLIASCDCAPHEDLDVRWAALLHDIAKPRTCAEGPAGVHFHGHDHAGAEMAEVILARFRASTQRTARVAHLIRHHMFDVPPAAGDTAIRRFIHRVGADAVDQLLVLRRADICGKTGSIADTVSLAATEDRVRAILRTKPAVTRGQLAINGRDLMAELSLPPGKTVGILLDELLSAVLDDPELNTRERLLEIARRFVASRLFE